MTSASSLAFPGSRTLAGWWRQLTPHRPVAFAVGYLFIHSVEAPVMVTRPKSLDRFSLLILQALEMGAGRASESPQELLFRLEQSLHLERPVLLQLLRGLETEGLLTPDGRWSLSPRGRQGLQYGHYAVDVLERRRFHFVERCDAAGARCDLPHFINLPARGGEPWQPDADHPFDAAWLPEHIGRPDSWKIKVGFPLEVRPALESIGTPQSLDEEALWQRVIVDHPRQMLTVLALAQGPIGLRLLGFGARQEGWQLELAEPILLLEDWQQAFPDVDDPSRDVLANAWQAWAAAHGLTAAEALTCRVALTGQRLRIEAPPTLMARLRVSKGENWLLLGEGFVRRAVQLELVSD